MKEESEDPTGTIDLVKHRKKKLSKFCEEEDFLKSQKLEYLVMTL